jgi:hypothetical protein
MIRRKTIMGAAGALLAFGVAAGSGAAFAQTPAHGFGMALKGTVQSVGSSSFQLETSAGSLVTVAFDAKTHVEKIVAGTTADLTSNARVEVQLKSGTTTVTAVTIEPAFNKPAGTTSGTARTHPVHTHPAKGTATGSGATGTKTGTKSGTKTGTKPARGTKPVTGSAHSITGGQVVSLSGNTLKLTGRGGTTATYTLASNVKITKLVAGTTSDLVQGETVQVFAPAGGTAREITILAS